MKILKYPRTQHLAGSNLQPGDEDLSQVRIESLLGCQLVVEEKIDGANSGICFDSKGELFLQSRGHYLSGGRREKHFALFKTWANCHRSALWALLSDRYLMYGEWVYAKHTIFYDHLPHYFLEFDIFDRKENCFLNTERRANMLAQSPVSSVPVLARGTVGSLGHLPDLVKSSLFKSEDWKKNLCIAQESIAGSCEETDFSDMAEGLYIKVEEAGLVTRRLKWVRHSFTTSVLDSGSHWLDRPIVANGLAPGVDIYGS